MDVLIDLARNVIPAILLIAALLVVRRRAAGGRVSGGGIRVLDRTGVTRGASVAVVEVDGRRFFVGATEHGINMLSELDATPPAHISVPDAHETATHSVPKTHGVHDNPADFSALVKRIMGPQDGRPASSDHRPRSGLVHRLQSMTVRTHVEAPLRDYQKN